MTTTATTIETLPAACPHCETDQEHRVCDDCGDEADVIDCGHYQQPAPIAAGHRGRTQCGRCYEIESRAQSLLDSLGRSEPEVYETLEMVGYDTVTAVAMDIGRVADDAGERAALLRECLDGADRENAPHWRSYVSAVAAAAEGL